MHNEPPRWALELISAVHRVETMGAEFKAQLDRMEMLLSSVINSLRFAAEKESAPMETSEVMALMKYKNRPAFNRAVRRERIPVIKISGKNHQFDPAEIHAWLKRKARNAF